MDKKSFITLGPGGSTGPDMFCNFYLLKVAKFPNNSATTEAAKK